MDSPGVLRAHDYSSNAKGWTGRKSWMASRWRAPIALISPIAEVRTNSKHPEATRKNGCAATSPKSCSIPGETDCGTRNLAPKGDRRMSANPHANGGLLLRGLMMPDFREYAVEVSKPGTQIAEATRVLGKLLRDVMKTNSNNFLVMGPDETVFESPRGSPRGHRQDVHRSYPREAMTISVRMGA